MAKTRIEQTLDYLEIERIRGYIAAYQNNVNLAKSMMMHMPLPTSDETSALSDYISTLSERISVMEGNIEKLRKAYLIAYSNPLDAAAPDFMASCALNRYPPSVLPDDEPKRKPKKAAEGK